jgi:hypothetical protein
MTRYASTLAVLVGASLGLMLTFAPQAHAVPTGTTCIAGGCFTDVVGDLRVDPSANSAVTNLEWCPGVAVTTLSDAQELAGRKVLAVQNASSANCYASFDADNPVSTDAGGWKIAPGDQHSFDLGDQIPVKVVCTAALATPSCLQVLQAK